jgi:hypothetical protein
MRIWSRIVDPLLRIDWPSAAMAVVAAMAVGWTIWLRFGPPAQAEPPKVGATPPALRLLDLARAEPVILVDLPGKVVWVVFWSAQIPSAQSDLRALATAWRRLEDEPRFAMVVAAVEVDQPALVRAAVTENAGSLPVYLATTETRQSYGVTEPPLHVVLGDDGRVLAVAHGGDERALNRLARQIEKRLELLEPHRKGRFAWKDGWKLDHIY